MQAVTQATDSAAQAIELLESGHYQQGADMALRVVGGTMTAVLSDTKTAPWSDGRGYRPHWRIRLMQGRRSYTFDFYGSINDGNKPTPPTPTAYTILSCITWYDPGTLNDFCDAFGYDNAAMARSTYNATVREYRNLCRLFTEEQRELLANVQ